MNKTSSLSPYAAEDLEAIESMKGKIIEELYINKLFKLDIYKKLNPLQIYFVGVDVSDGYGSDNSAITIFDPYTLQNVAEFKSPYISPSDLRNFLIVLVQKYLPNAIVNIEQNRGAALISDLLQSPIRHRIYFETKTEIDPTEKLDAKGMLIQEAARRRNFGICTTTKTRPIMFGLLEVYVREHKDAFVTEGLISELMGLIRKNDKIQAGPGFHDDIVMSMLMNLYVYYHGSNLARFGFYPGSLPDETKRNKGLDYDVNEIMGALSESEQRYFGNSVVNRSYKDLDYGFFQEMQKARNMVELNTSGISSINQVVNMDYDNTGIGGVVDLSLDLFNELNDY